MKFDRQLQPATETSWVVSYGGKKFQYGGRPPFWKSIYRHISVKNHRIFMKFCTQQQILNWMNVTWWKMKKLHWTDYEFDITYRYFLLVLLCSSLTTVRGTLDRVIMSLASCHICDMWLNGASQAYSYYWTLIINPTKELNGTILNHLAWPLTWELGLHFWNSGTLAHLTITFACCQRVTFRCGQVLMAFSA